MRFSEKKTLSKRLRNLRDPRRQQFFFTMGSRQDDSGDEMARDSHHRNDLALDSKTNQVCSICGDASDVHGGCILRGPRRVPLMHVDVIHALMAFSFLAVIAIVGHIMKWPQS